MAQEDVRLSGTFLDSAGNALASKTVTLFSEGTITPALATDTTDSSGDLLSQPVSSLTHTPMVVLLLLVLPQSTVSVQRLNHRVLNQRLPV
mgnify:CR=1 FL=1